MKRLREKRRTENSSIRFDAVKYDSICKKEGLKTPQQVVDFLVDKYWWEDKIGSVPTLERQAVQVTNLTPEPEKSNYTINTTPDDFRTKTENKIKAYEEELTALGAGSAAAQRRMFIQKELAALRRILD